MPDIDLNKLTRRGGIARLSVKVGGQWRQIGTIRGPRHSKGWRKHVRRMKARSR